MRLTALSPTRAGLAAVASAALVSLAGCGSGSTTTTAPAPSAPATSTSAHAGGARTPSTGPSNPLPTTAPTSAPATPESHPTEFSPPGDIPDNAVFVDHTAPNSAVHFTVPEGWAESTTNGIVTYTDKYNSVNVEVRKQPQPSTVSSVKSQDVSQLQSSAPNFQLESVGMVTRQHGDAVLVTYLTDSAPDPVTDKVVRDEVLRFQFWHAGQEAVLSLTGPQNADNVDPWQIVSDSLHWK